MSFNLTVMVIMVLFICDIESYRKDTNYIPLLSTRFVFLYYITYFFFLFFLAIRLKNVCDEIKTHCTYTRYRQNVPDYLTLSQCIFKFSGCLKNNLMQRRRKNVRDKVALSSEQEHFTPLKNDEDESKMKKKKIGIIKKRVSTTSEIPGIASQPYSMVYYSVVKRV